MTTRLSLRLPPAMREQLIQYARSCGQPLSVVVRLGVQSLLDTGHYAEILAEHMRTVEDRRTPAQQAHGERLLERLGQLDIPAVLDRADGAMHGRVTET